MPIKPENRALYPKDWKAIRAEVLDRAGHQCERCGVQNHVCGLRAKNGDWYDEKQINGMNSDWGCALFGYWRPPIRIVLTIAHLDHNPRNNGEPGARPNLQALCQKCHLDHDRDHHLANGRRTRDAKKGQVVLALEAEGPRPAEPSPRTPLVTP